MHSPQLLPNTKLLTYISTLILGYRKDAYLNTMYIDTASDIWVGLGHNGSGINIALGHGGSSKCAADSESQGSNDSEQGTHDG
jgi:hypothetical protein